MDDIIKLMEQLAENPLSYELHLKLVADMKAAGLDDELRSARESMHDVFPLTEDLWMQWLEDEKAKSDTEEQRRYILALYTMAVDDYLSIPIWKDYVEFVSDAALPDVDEDEMDTDSSKEGWLSMDDARTIFGNAKRTTEYHLTRSHIIWNVIKDFELRALERDPSEEKVEKVRQMLLERLAVPHMKLSDTFTDYSSFETKYDLENYDNRVLAANAIKAKTEKEFFKRDTFEMKLLGDSPQLSDYLDYIISETKGKSVNKKIVRTLYERAVTVFCLHTTVWDHYVSFLISSYRVKDIVIGVCDRAIRNCSWSGAIWAHRLRIGAGFNEDVEDLKTALQRGLDFLAQASIEEWVAAILGYCDGLAVTLVKGGITEEVKEVVRSIYNEGMDFVKQKFGPDPYFRIERSLLSYETALFKDAKAARELYQLFLKPNPTSSSLWIEFAYFERDHGTLAQARSIFKQAVQRKLDNPESFFAAWIAFEEQFGNVDQYYDALGRIKNQERIVEGWRAKEAAAAPLPMDISEIAYPMPNGLEEKTVAVKREREEEVEVEPVAKKVKSEDPAVEVEGLEIEEAEKTEEQQLAAKSRDYYIVNNSNAGNMITIKNLPIAFEAEKLKLIFGNKKRLVLDYYIEPDVQTNEPRGFVEFSKAEEATAAASRTGLRISGIPVEIRRCIPAKVKWENFDKEGGEQQTKIFVSNLDKTVDKPLLRKVFGQFGKINEIRLVPRESHAFAYVEFELEKSALKACSLDNTMLEGYPGRRMSVKISNPSMKKEKVQDKKELFVANFPLASTKEELIDLFKEYGKVKDCRFLYNRDGLPRGAGFIEFEDEDAAKAALALNGAKVGDRLIAVSPADPNVRGGRKDVGGFKGKEKGKFDRTGSDRDRPGFNRPPPRQGLGFKPAASEAPKTALPMVPRNTKVKALKKSHEIPGEATTAKADSTLMPPPPPPGPLKKASEGNFEKPKGAKSQDDFRKMLSGEK